MNYIKYLTTFALSCCCALPIQAKELIIDREQDDPVVIEIGSDDSFLAILEWIQQMLEENDRELKKNFMANAALNDEKNFIVEISHLDRITVSKASKKYLQRDYFAPVTQKEKDDISYILKTLHAHTFVTLAPHRSALKKAGERVDNVHPFRFLQCIFTDEDLKVCVRSIQGKTFIWGEFLKGITTSLKEETKKNNLPPEYLADFALQIGIDVGAIYPSYSSQQWEELVNVLINIVPRTETNNPDDRYNI